MGESPRLEHLSADWGSADLMKSVPSPAWQSCFGLETLLQPGSAWSIPVPVRGFAADKLSLVQGCTTCEEVGLTAAFAA